MRLLVAGVAAAVLSPAALSLVTSMFSHGRERHRALGTFSALGAGGFAMGVFLGGLLTDGPGWRWVFFIAVPFGLLGTLLACLVLPRTTPAEVQTAQVEQERFDWLGAVLLGPSVALLLLALTFA